MSDVCSLPHSLSVLIYKMGLLIPTAVSEANRIPLDHPGKYKQISLEGKNLSGIRSVNCPTFLKAQMTSLAKHFHCCVSCCSVLCNAVWGRGQSTHYHRTAGESPHTRSLGGATDWAAGLRSHDCLLQSGATSAKGSIALLAWPGRASCEDEGPRRHKNQDYYKQHFIILLWTSK